VGQPTLGKSIRCPASIVDSEPNEELAVHGGPTLPDSFPGSKFDRTNKEGHVGRFAGVLPRPSKTPMVLVRGVLM
jgi:hypothetical protein